MINFYEHIDGFMTGNLDEDTLSSMNDAISKDNHLKEAISNYPTAKKISEALLEIDILEKINSLELEESPEKLKGSSQSIFRKGIGFLILLLILLSLVVGYKYLTNQKAEQQNVLFASLYTPPVDMDAVRSITIENLDPFSKGKYYFSLNDYAQALVYFKEAELILADKNKSTNYSESILNYWMGHVYINTQEWELAKIYFEKSKEPESKKNIDLIKRIQNL